MKPQASHVLLVTLSVACLLASCKPEMVAEAPQKASDSPVISHTEPDRTFTIFLSGNVLGMLKPCGCSSGQLGGFDRRAAILNQIPEDKKLVIDTGRLLAGDSQQDSIKITTIFQAMTLLDYDAVNLTRTDLTIARDLGLLEDNTFKLLTASDDSIPATFTRYIKVANRKVQINVSAVDTEFVDIDTFENIFPETTEKLKFNILIAENLDCSEDSEIRKNIETTNLVDIIVCPSESDKPEILSVGENGPLRITVGRLGEYLGELKLGIAKDNSLKLNYKPLAIHEKLPVDQDIAKLYSNYQQMLKDYNLLEELPKIPLPDGLSYAGSDACKLCHGYEYDKWSTKKHAHAYQTLVEVGSQYDPECIECHVVGLKYESGFINESSNKDLRNVSCEVCHGPCSKHISSLINGDDMIEPGSPKFACDHCHTPEHSPEYEANKAQYFKKIIHWK